MERNLFEGDSYYAQFANLSYDLFIKREWVTYSLIMAEYYGKESIEDLPYTVAKCDHYGELKKAFVAVRITIEKKTGMNCFEEYGNNRNKRFRYIGDDDDPLRDLKNAIIIKDLRHYWRFCQDSAGFYPFSWLEYFFKDSKDLLNIKTRKRDGKQVINTSLDRIHTNIEFLPMLYESIINKQVLEIDYKPFNGKVETFIFHPHYLKEYNGRWHLLGHCEGHLPENGYNLSLDHILSRPREKSKVNYLAAPPMFYEDYFKDIVGLTLLKNAKTEDVIIRAHTLYMFMLTNTKPIHYSQEICTPFGKHQDGTYGEFRIRVKVNNEFIGCILQMGDGLEIIAPKRVRELFRRKTTSLAKLYDE